MAKSASKCESIRSAEDGLIGGTWFEVEYAERVGIPVQVHREKGLSQWIFQYSFPFLEEKGTFSWHGKGFSIKSVLRWEVHDEVLNLWAQNRLGR